MTLAGEHRRSAQFPHGGLVVLRRHDELGDNYTFFRRQFPLSDQRMKRPEEQPNVLPRPQDRHDPVGHRVLNGGGFGKRLQPRHGYVFQVRPLSALKQTPVWRDCAGSDIQPFVRDCAHVPLYLRSSFAFAKRGADRNGRGRFPFRPALLADNYTPAERDLENHVGFPAQEQAGIFPQHLPEGGRHV